MKHTTGVVFMLLPHVTSTSKLLKTCIDAEPVYQYWLIDTKTAIDICVFQVFATTVRLNWSDQYWHWLIFKSVVGVFLCTGNAYRMFGKDIGALATLLLTQLAVVTIRSYFGVFIDRIYGFAGKLVTVKYLRLDRYHQRFPQAQDCTAPLWASSTSCAAIANANVTTSQLHHPNSSWY